MSNQAYRFILFVIWFGIQTPASGQSTMPSVMNTSGSFFSNDRFFFDWNIGEGPGIKTIFEDRYIFTEGYCQTLLMPGMKADDRRGTVNENGILLMPNPAHDVIFAVAQQNNFGHATIMISDIQGKKLIQKKAYLHPEFKEPIQLSPLQPGVYFVTVLQPYASATAQKTIFKIIKK